MNNLSVIEFQGLAPSVFCGMYFADQGADVTIISRKEPVAIAAPVQNNVMHRNKKCIELSLKDSNHLNLLRQMLKTADIIIDPYRPGVLQKLKLGPKQLYEINKKIILLRVSGYGQKGEMNLRPGHDLNYMAVSGILPLLNKKGQNQFPMNFFADFVSASLGITGVLVALQKRQKTNEGSIVDCSLADGCLYFSQFLQDTNLKQYEPNTFFTTYRGQDYVITSPFFIEAGEAFRLCNGRQYYKSLNGNIEISVIKKVPDFDINKIKNPFQTVTNFIKKKGEDTQKIAQKYGARL